MNTSNFVGSFEEIRALSEQDQLEILEQARYAAFTELRLGGRAALYLVLTILGGFIVVAMASRYTGMAFMPVWVGLGGLFSVLLYQRSLKGLLHQGLARVLASRDA